MTSPFSLFSYNLQFMHEAEDAKVFKATDMTGKQFVVKFTLVYGNYDPAAHEVYSELMTINHPNLVKVFEVGIIMPQHPEYKQLYNMMNWDYDNGSVAEVSLPTNTAIPYVLMEYIDGVSVDNKSEIEPISLCQDMLAAIKVLQNHSIVHDDVQTQNILFDPTNNRYVLIDFDLSYHDADGEDTHRDVDLFMEVLLHVLRVNQPVTNSLLPNTTAINKFYNATVTMISPDLGVDDYTTLLSQLLGGDYVLTLPLEHGVTEVWQHGVRIQ